jgi:hypothetical protein
MALPSSPTYKTSSKQDNVQNNIEQISSTNYQATLKGKKLPPPAFNVVEILDIQIHSVDFSKL